MLQLQYFNPRIKNKHINNIIDNYKLKYSGIKHELFTTINNLINQIIKDISLFLEKNEEISKAKQKLNNYDKIKAELDSIRHQLKAKIYNENKIRNELGVLTQENSMLKLKLKSLKRKLRITKSNESVLFTPKKLMRSSFNNRNYNNSYERKTSAENSFNKLDISFISRYDHSSKVLDQVEKCYKKINRKKSLDLVLKQNSKKKSINQSFNNSKDNKINSNNITNINKRKKNIKKFLINSNKMNKSYKKKKNQKDKINTLTPFNSPLKMIKLNQFKESNNDSLNNSEEINDECNSNSNNEDIEKKINYTIDEELKQLELDEEKIKKLLEKINKGKNNEINSGINNMNKD